MKRLIIAIIAVISVTSVSAQPAKSRVAENAARTGTAARNTTRTAAPTATSRAALMFPTAVDVPEEVTWRRDIYRELDLTKDENAALFYPVEPQDGRVNLFTLLFQLLNKGQIPAYKYETSGLENFSQSNRMHFKDMLDRYKIPYEVQGNTIDVNPIDIPSNEVLYYFVKESSYFDQNTATYHSRVTALCPVIYRSIDDFSMQLVKQPMFWVKISDVEAYLSQHMVMTSNINNAAQMSMADFFATNKYKGTIYMTTNMQGKTLAEVARDSVMAKEEKEPLAKEDSILIKEQLRIERQMKDFEKNIWATPVDSAEIAMRDSIAAAEAAAKKAKKATTSSRAARTTKTTEKTEKAAKTEKSSSGSSSAATAPRVSVRRERH